MGRTPQDEPVFLIGLTMAGAVSAGAYTAGVLDFLFRAIDAHNARVRKGVTPEDPDPPRHRIVVKTMSGASAGGMCTGLAIASLMKNRREVEGEARLGTPKSYSYQGMNGGGPQEVEGSLVLEPQHQAWVEQIGLWHPETGKGFLASEGQTSSRAVLGSEPAPPGQKQPVRSALNSLHLDDVARDAVSDIPEWGNQKPFDFLARDLDLFLTTTNLNGVVYTVDFERRKAFTMGQHSSVRHFRLEGMGTTPHPSDWLDAWGDHGIPLDLQEKKDGKIPFVSDPKSNWARLLVAALASGAFPVGLAPRRIDATQSEQGQLGADGKARGGALPMDVEPGGMGLARPTFPAGSTADTEATYVSVDGGVINNEPFELARYTLRRMENKTLESNPRDHKSADRAVIMIDPFPEGPTYETPSPATISRLSALIPSALKLLPTLIQQSRFKWAEVLAAQDEKIASRFLISPRRVSEDGEPVFGADAIACGALSGFSGFFDKSFRTHDFALGQRNCQRFLKKHFMIDADNPVLGLPADHADLQAASNARSHNEPAPRRPVVDAFAEHGGDLSIVKEVVKPAWPKMDGDALASVFEQMRVRLGEVSEPLLDVVGGGKGLRQALVSRAWKGLGPLLHGVEKRAADAIAGTVTAVFLRRDQLADYASFAPGVRLALLQLIEAGDDYRTAAELVDSVQLGHLPSGGAIPSAEEVENALVHLKTKNRIEQSWWPFSSNKYRFKR